MPKPSKHILLGLLWLCISSVFAAQQNTKQVKIDSLQGVLSSVQNDDDRFLILSQIGWQYLDYDNEKSVAFSLSAFQYADSVNNQELKSETSYAIAQAYNGMGDYSSAMEYFSIANELSKSTDNKVRSINIENGMGNLYLANEEFRQAMVHYGEANRLSRELNDSNMIGITNVGLGFGFTSIGQHDSAIVYYQEALAVLNADKDKFTYGAVYANMATSLLALGRKNDALLLAKKSLALMLDVGNQYGLASTYEIVGEIYYEIGQYELALEEYYKALKIFSTIKSYDNLQRVYNDMAILYARIGEKEMAYDYLSKHIHLKDSLFNRSKERILAEMESKYENELKTHQIEILNKEKKARDIEMEFQKQEEQYVIIALIIIALFLAYVTYFYFKNKRLNKDLHQSISQVTKQHEKIERQNDQLTEVHNEILSSIKYAKKIQRAVLPPDEMWNKELDDSFVLYMPKDVVSGDFYWMHSINEDEVLFAALDCTGHGVPGGFMSIVGYHALETNVNEFKLNKPANILDGMRHVVNDMLHRGFEGDDVKDGMDVAMCNLNKKTGRLLFAGAYNPVWILRDGEIIEFKGTKQAVGMFTNDHVPFESHEIQLVEGDIIYIGSDGYLDQFGGEFGKKIMSKGLKKILSGYGDLSMKKQKIELTKYFYNWMNETEEEQGDDVTIIGIKYNGPSK